jgi:hypothetical protein
MPNKTIEDVINDVLKNETKENALELIAHVRLYEKPEQFSISMHDGKDESGWNVSNLGFIFINGSDDFPGPWTMWVQANNIGEHSELPVDEHIKEFAWSHVSPCGNCGAGCNTGTRTTVFGKIFENVCQHNLMFNNPDAETVSNIMKILDIKKRDVLTNISSGG